ALPICVRPLTTRGGRYLRRHFSYPECTMNIFADFIDRVMKAVESLDLKAKDGGALDFSRITVEPPRDSTHGDLATNAAMVLSKAAGENPRALGERLAKVLAEDP